MSAYCEQCKKVWDGEGCCRECYDKYHRVLEFLREKGFITTSTAEKNEI